MTSGASLGLWFGQVWPAAELAHHYASVLSDDERQRQARFKFARDALLFGAARGLLRTALSERTGVAPEDWRFRRTAYGQPQVESPAEGRPHQFSVTHTQGLVACAIADVPVGIDAERVAARDDLVSITLHPSEVVSCQGLHGEARVRRCLQYWVLKEAYLKARGVGLSLDPREIWFSGVEPGARPGLVDERRHGSGWWFELMDLSTAHTFALAVASNGRRPAVQVKEVDLLAPAAVQQPCRLGGVA